MGITGFAGANEIPGAQSTMRGSEVRIALGNDYSGVTLSISGPNGFYAKTFSKGSSASIDLIRAGARESGLYTYELTAASSETTIDPNPMNNGRGSADAGATKVPVMLSGSFYAEGGLIDDKASQAEEKN